MGLLNVDARFRPGMMGEACMPEKVWQTSSRTINNLIDKVQHRVYIELLIL